MPADERSRAVALYSSAAILGTLAALVLTGLLVAKYGWPSVFYGFGLLGIVYALYWFSNVYETPEDHPHVTEAEHVLLASNKPVKGASDQIPWRRIFSLPCMYALLITYFLYKLEPLCLSFMDAQLLCQRTWFEDCWGRCLCHDSMGSDVCDDKRRWMDR